jgi:mono/diheme cytochrome c family protein
MVWLKRIGIGLGVLVVLLLLSGSAYVLPKSSAFEASMDKVYDVPLPRVTRSTDPAVLARGKHLVDATTGCSSSDCHGADLAGGKTMSMGPLGTFTAPNITPGGIIAAYSDGELARVIRHGLRKDGRSVRFMPSQDYSWLPDNELEAIVSYLRTVEAVSRPNGPLEAGLLAKVLDRNDMLVLDVARRIDHAAKELVPAPEPTAAYGKFLARSCQGCHGNTYAGGPIPGAPASMPVPTNLTPHATGLAGYTYEHFDRLLLSGTKKDGKKLDPFMPIESFGKMDEIEKRALFAFLITLPQKPFGER